MATGRACVSATRDCREFLRRFDARYGDRWYLISIPRRRNGEADTCGKPVGFLRGLCPLSATFLCRPRPRIRPTRGSVRCRRAALEQASVFNLGVRERRSERRFLLNLCGCS
eukprot:scaffold52459_cov63-Phaeocystis_antarctica.AAC.2